MKNNNNAIKLEYKDFSSLTYDGEEEIFVAYTNPCKQDQVTALQDSISALKNSIKSLGTGKPNVYTKMLSRIKVLQTEIPELEKAIKKDEFSKAQNKILKPYIKHTAENSEENVSSVDPAINTKIRFNIDEETTKKLGIYSNKLSYEKGIKKDEFFKAQNKILKSYIQSEVEKEKTPSLSSIDDIMQESDYIPFSFFGHDTSASGAVYLIPNSVSEENNAIEKEMTRKPEIDSNKFSYFIGSLNGMFVVSPMLRYGHDKINGLSPNKALIEYYKEVFSTEYVAQTGIAVLSALAVPLVDVGFSYYGLNINIGSSVQAQSNEFLTPFWQGIIYSSLPDAIVLGNDIIQYSYNYLNDCF